RVNDGHLCGEALADSFGQLACCLDCGDSREIFQDLPGHVPLVASELQDRALAREMRLQRLQQISADDSVEVVCVLAVLVVLIFLTMVSHAPRLRGLRALWLQRASR